MHSCKMWCLVLIRYCPQGQLNSFLRKNLSLYSSIGAWLVIALNALVHNELEWPKYLSYKPSLIYDGFIVLLSLSTRLRKYLPFISDTWNIIFYLFTRLLYSFFLFKSQDDLLGKSRVGLNNFISISTALYRNHLYWLGHF